MHRAVLITGATDGLGLGVAECAAADDNHLILHGRNAERLAAGATRIEQPGYHYRRAVRPHVQENGIRLVRTHSAVSVETIIGVSPW